MHVIRLQSAKKKQTLTVTLDVFIVFEIVTVTLSLAFLLPHLPCNPMGLSYVDIRQGSSLAADFFTG